MQLSLPLSVFFLSVALGSPSDILYIQKLNADEAHKLDNKDFAGLGNIFTKNASYNAGAPSQTVYGIDNIQAILAEILPPELLTENAISTESITLLPPFDEQGAAGTATGVVYSTTANIGQGDLEGQGVFVRAKYKDKYVKTGDFAIHGGWRISERLFISFGKPVGNQDVLPPSLRT